MKIVLGILSVIILVAVSAFIYILWLASALNIQNEVLDNFVQIKQDLILSDRNLSFSYQSYGVEMEGLNPALTLIDPLLILKDGAQEYRFSAKEIRFVNPFFYGEATQVRAPEEVYYTVKNNADTPKNYILQLPSHLKLNLFKQADSVMWESYQLPSFAKDTIVIKRDDTIVARLDYQFPKLPPRDLNPPYSPKLKMAIHAINQKIN